MKRTLKTIVILTALAIAGPLAAQAAEPGGNDALVTSHSRVSLSQAVQAAEQQVPGQGVRAELESSRKGWVYDVEVVKNSAVYDVAVDAATGTVVAAAADKTDADDGHDQKD